MTVNQYTRRDPRTQYATPDEQRGQEQRHPGSGDAMGPEPDHGEDSYEGHGRLSDRKVVITGGDSGIGRAVAGVRARGADVLLSYLDEEQEDADRTAELVRAAGRGAVLVPGDIRDEAHCAGVIDRAVAEFRSRLPSRRPEMVPVTPGHGRLRPHGGAVARVWWTARSRR